MFEPSLIEQYTCSHITAKLLMFMDGLFHLIIFVRYETHETLKLVKNKKDESSLP